VLTDLVRGAAAGASPAGIVLILAATALLAQLNPRPPRTSKRGRPAPVKARSLPASGRGPDGRCTTISSPPNWPMAAAWSPPTSTGSRSCRRQRAGRSRFTSHRACACPDLLALGEAARDAFGPLYLDVLRWLDGLFGVRMPYVAAWHQASVRSA